jgi:hypothetical protein
MSCSRSCCQRARDGEGGTVEKLDASEEAKEVAESSRLWVFPGAWVVERGGGRRPGRGVSRVGGGEGLKRSSAMGDIRVGAGVMGMRLGDSERGGVAKKDGASVGGESVSSGRVHGVDVALSASEKGSRSVSVVLFDEPRV